MLALGLGEGVAHAAAKPWPQLYGQVGTYGFQTADDVDAMAKAGLTLAITFYQGQSGARLDALKRNGIHYVDVQLSALTRAACATQIKAGAKTCVVSPDDENKILADVQKHLQQTAQDPNIVAYWTLDDYPHGDIHNLLEKVHDLVAAANATSVVARPTVCGVGGDIDVKKNATDRAFHTHYDYAELSLVNVTPHACDIVALYPYATNDVDDPGRVDWSMGPLLAHTLQSLRARGWDPSKQPWIGVVQTFGYGINDQFRYVTPRAQDIVNQMVGFCRAGASAIFAYSWNDSYAGTKKEPTNTPYMAQALQDGAKQCKQYWR